MKSESKERYRKAGLGIAVGLLERFASTATGALRVPLLLRALGHTGYGLWVASFGLVQSATALSFGIQYGLVNFVAQARGRNEEAGIRSIVATAFAVYSAVGVITLAVFAAVAGVLPLPWVLGVDGPNAHTATFLVALGLTAYLLSLPLKVFAAALNGYQEQYLVSAWNTVTGVVQVAGLWALVSHGGEDLAKVAIYFVGTDLTASALLAAWVLIRHRPSLRFRLRDIRRSLVPSLFRVGLYFFLADLANTLKWSIGSVVVSHHLGLEAVPLYSVGFQLFMMAYAIGSSVASSFWPAFAEAAAAGDWAWVDMAQYRGTSAGLAIAGLFAAMGACLGRDVVVLWAGPTAASGYPYYCVLSAWLLVQVWINAPGAVLCALSLNRVVAIVALVEAGLAFVSSVFLVRFMGVTGIGIGMAGAGILTSGLVLPLALSRATNGKVTSRWSLPLRAVLLTAATAGLGLVGARLAAAQPPLVRILLVAPPVSVAYLAFAARYILDPSTRTAVVARLGRLRRQAG